jgi:hypothetical protein
MRDDMAAEADSPARAQQTGQRLKNVVCLFLFADHPQ